MHWGDRETDTEIRRKKKEVGNRGTEPDPEMQRRKKKRETRVPYSFTNRKILSATTHPNTR